MPSLEVKTLPRVEAQRAVGCHALRDVLLSLRRNGLIQAFRVHEDRVVVITDRALDFLFTASDDA